MSKYNNFINYSNTPMRTPLVEGEKIIWDAKPKRKAFILNQVIAMMPLALIWLAIDMTIILSILFSGDAPKEIFFFIIPFFALHLMPVWIWLGNVISANKRWVNTVYYITDKRIIIQTGFVGIDYASIYFKDISYVNLNVGFIDKFLGVGDIHFTLKQGATSRITSFLDITDPYEIYPKLQKIVLDMQTDMEFPNAYRPNENPGYTTEYKPDGPIKY